MPITQVAEGQTSRHTTRIEPAANDWTTCRCARLAWCWDQASLAGRLRPGRTGPQQCLQAGEAAAGPDLTACTGPAGSVQRKLSTVGRSQKQDGFAGQRRGDAAEQDQQAGLSRLTESRRRGHRGEGGGSVPRRDYEFCNTMHDSWSWSYQRTFTSHFPSKNSTVQKQHPPQTWPPLPPAPSHIASVVPAWPPAMSPC